MNFGLQKRDILLLAFLAQQGVAYAEQLMKIGRFENANSFYIRISCLKRAGVIESKRLNTVQDRKRRAIYMLGASLREQSRNAKAMSVETMWQHQLKLNDLREALDLIFPGASNFVEGHIRSQRYCLGESTEEAIPDLLIHWRDKKIAIEMERTLKWDKDRYYAKWLAYQKLPYDKILYFCNDDGMRYRLCQLGEKFENIGFSTLLDYESIHTRRFGVDKIKSFISRENILPYKEIEL